VQGHTVISDKEVAERQIQIPLCLERFNALGQDLCSLLISSAALREM
jgi:hypothetical protein